MTLPEAYLEMTYRRMDEADKPETIKSAFVYAITRPVVVVNCVMILGMVVLTAIRVAG